MVECKHCGVIYSHQASGGGCCDEPNDSKYCPICKQALIDALKKISVKYEYRWVDTDEFTKEEALAIIAEEERIAEEKVNKQRAMRKKCPECELISPFWGINMRRVFPGLWDMKTGESSTEKMFKHNGFNYYISYWEKRPNDYNIRKEVRWDLEKDKISSIQDRYHRNE